MAYMVVVGFVTVIPAVFMREPTRAPTYESCAVVVESLTEALLQRASEHVAEARPAATLTPFFRRWDERFVSERVLCAENSDAAKELERLRYRMELSLHRFGRDEGALVRRVDRSVGR